MLNRLNKKKELKESAAFVITQACKTYLNKKRASESMRNISNKNHSTTAHSIYTHSVINTNSKIYNTSNFDENSTNLQNQ